MTSRRSIVLNAALLLAALSCIEPTAARNPPLPSKTDASQFALAFERNQGQFDAPVRFLSRGPGYTLFLTDDEAVWRVLGASGDQVLRMQLIDGKATHARGERPLKPRHHYLDLRSGTARARHVETYAATRMVSVRQRPFFPAGFCFGSLIGFPLAVVSHIGSP
ncbi:MAG: hypothetical protein DYH17_16435, partial [Xanthomonadales bacterium PRO6]|nr:hypothetical protein [Xanthomonadales bacterium PRO6]